MKTINYNHRAIPAKVFNGGLFFYIPKIGLALFALFFGTVGMFMLSFGTYWTLTSGALNREMVGLLAILLFGSFSTIFIAIVVLHMYPQIGISTDCLWYRHFFFGWNSLRWQDIEEIRAAKTVFVTQGTVVFSTHLPWYYRFFGRSYGRRKGKALFIPNQLITHQEFLALLRQYNIQVRILV